MATPQEGLKPTAAGDPETPARLLPSQLIRAGVTGLCLGAGVGVASFQWLLGALTRSLTSPIIVNSTADLAGRHSIYCLVCGLAGFLVAIAGLVWSRSGRWADRLATTFVIAALALSSATVAVRLLRIDQPRPPSLPLPAGVPLPEVFVPVNQVPVLWPPVVACAVLIVVLIFGIRRRSRGGKPMHPFAAKTREC